MTIAERIRKIAEDARQASLAMARLSSGAKNELLLDMALALVNNTPHMHRGEPQGPRSGGEEGSFRRHARPPYAGCIADKGNGRRPA